MSDFTDGAGPPPESGLVAAKTGYQIEPAPEMRAVISEREFRRGAYLLGLDPDAVLAGKEEDWGQDVEPPLERQERFLEWMVSNYDAYDTTEWPPWAKRQLTRAAAGVFIAASKQKSVPISDGGPWKLRVLITIQKPEAPIGWASSP